MENPAVESHRYGVPNKDQTGTYKSLSRNPIHQKLVPFETQAEPVTLVGSELTFANKNVHVEIQGNFEECRQEKPRDSRYVKGSTEQPNR